jgi:menaquinone-dependent protoporphyrinogen IX oxidase
MKTIVLYTSKRGSTERYAKWIAEELDCEAIAFSKDKLNIISSYDTVVYGGWVRGGGIVGLVKIRKNFKKLEGKNLIVFAVGLSIDNKDNYLQLRDLNFKSPLNLAPLYVCAGAFDPEKVKGGEKLIVGVLKKIIGSNNKEVKKGINDDNETEMIKSLSEGVDLVDRKYIIPIIDYVKGLKYS